MHGAKMCCHKLCVIPVHPVVCINSGPRIPFITEMESSGNSVIYTR